MDGKGTKTCLFCHLQKKVGLSILAAFICCDCAKKLVNTPCYDGAYENFLQGLKEFWHGLAEEKS